MTKIERTVLRVNRSSFPELVASISSAIALAWGLTLILSPHSFAGPTFADTFGPWRPPALWGCLMVVFAIRMLFAVWGGARSAGWALAAAFAFVALWSLWGATVALSVPSHGVPPWASMTLGLLNLAITVLYAVERRTGVRR